MESIKDSPVLQGAKVETWEGIDQGLTGDEWIQVWITHMKKQDALEVERQQKALATN
jgi:hypothetical protein